MKTLGGLVHLCTSPDDGSSHCRQRSNLSPAALLQNTGNENAWGAGGDSNLRHLCTSPDDGSSHFRQRPNLSPAALLPNALSCSAFLQVLAQVWPLAALRRWPLCVFVLSLC